MQLNDRTILYLLLALIALFFALVPGADIGFNNVLVIFVAMAALSLLNGLMKPAIPVRVRSHTRKLWTRPSP